VLVKGFVEVVGRENKDIPGIDWLLRVRDGRAPSLRATPARLRLFKQRNRKISHPRHTERY
jgi:hypothetical protein